MGPHFQRKLLPAVALVLRILWSPMTSTDAYGKIYPILTWCPSIISCVNFDIRQFFSLILVARIEHRYCTDNALRIKISIFNETCDVENSLIRTTGGTWNKFMRHDFAESNALYFFPHSLVMFNLVTYIKHSHLLTKITLCPHIWKFDSWLAYFVV